MFSRVGHSDKGIGGSRMVIADGYKVANETDHEKYELRPLGDSGLLIKLGDRMDESMLAKVTAVTRAIENHSVWSGFIECVPAYASVALYYHPYLVKNGRTQSEMLDDTVFRTVCNRVLAVLDQLDFSQAAREDARIVNIPVHYGGEDGPDLDEVAAIAGMAPDEVVALHSNEMYTVHMIGFTPGFPYLGGMPKAISSPRRAVPRMLIPPGSVGIAGGQTGIYPIGTPGGWQIIGRTPMALFRPEQSQPSLLRSGDRIRFVPITKEQYEDWPTGEYEEENNRSKGG
ncbi:5-oxoprolinase subunit PxpB [Paenibacillus sp. strain BS8-2]